MLQLCQGAATVDLVDDQGRRRQSRRLVSKAPRSAGHGVSVFVTPHSRCVAYSIGRCESATVTRLTVAAGEPLSHFFNPLFSQRLLSCLTAGRAAAVGPLQAQSSSMSRACRRLPCETAPAVLSP